MTVSVGVFFNNSTTVITRVVKADTVPGLGNHSKKTGEGLSTMERVTYDTMTSMEAVANYLGLRTK
jgi:hypothetical protein